jgi:hypothetical protein
MHHPLRRECSDQRAIAQRTIARAIQVDDVQPAGAECAIACQQAEWIGRVARFGVEIALIEPHAGAAAQVDGRDQKHGSDRKFRNTRAPAVDERSG